MKSHRLSARIVLALLIGGSAIHAHAWGEHGHRVVAQIAWHYLTPQTRQRVTELLQGDQSGLTATDFFEEATWADRYRDSDRTAAKTRYEQTRRWHYVNLQLDAPDLKQACHGRKPLPRGTRPSAGPAQACSVDKVEQFARAWRSDATSRDERRLALQFLIHLVGDLHQPLHASDNHDSGANDKRILVGNAKPRSLHSFWDTELVRRLGRKPERLAQKLIAENSAAELARWRRGNADDWALETFAVARDEVYAPLPTPRADGSYRLEASYIERAKPVAALQLRRAGVRLAALLNAAD